MRRFGKVVGLGTAFLALTAATLIFVPLGTPRERAERDYQMKFPPETRIVSHDPLFGGPLGKWVYGHFTEVTFPEETYRRWAAAHRGFPPIPDAGSESYGTTSLPGMDYTVLYAVRTDTETITLKIHAGPF